MMRAKSVESSLLLINDDQSQFCLSTNFLKYTFLMFYSVWQTVRQLFHHTQWLYQIQTDCFDDYDATIRNDETVTKIPQSLYIFRSFTINPSKVFLVAMLTTNSLYSRHKTQTVLSFAIKNNVQLDIVYRLYLNKIKWFDYTTLVLYTVISLCTAQLVC